MFNLKNLTIAAALAATLTGCGGGGGGGGFAFPGSGSSSVNATFIDDFVGGLKYVNGSNTGYTDANGQFPYESGEVVFYVGDIRIGSITSMPSDNKIFIQDLLGIPRTNTTDATLLKIGRFLQSLDSDPSTDAIEISQANNDLFEEPSDTETDFQDQGVSVDTLLGNAGFAANEIVSSADAQNHIENILEAEGELTTSTVLSLSNSSVSNGATNVLITTDIDLTFTDDIPLEYLTSNYIYLTDTSSGNSVPATISRAQNVVTVTPDSSLNYSTTYELTIKSTIKNYAGDDISLSGNVDAVISFTTESQVVNQAPTISIAGGLAHNVASGSTLTIDASGTTDPESDPLTYTYTIRSGLQTIANISNTSSSSYLIDTVAGNFSAGTYDISVVATDSNGATDVYNGKFAVVSNVNFVAPVADAGPDIIESITNSVYIDGSASSDDVGIASYLWLNGTGQVGNNNGLSFGAGSFGTPQTRTFTLYVTDDDGAIAADTMDLILTN